MLVSIFLSGLIIVECGLIPEFNSDAVIEDGGKCLFHIICDLNSPLEVKPMIDALADETLQFYDKGTQDFDLALNVENMRSDDIWMTRLPEIACSTGPDFREAITKRFASLYYQRLSEKCFENDDDECRGLRKLVEIQQIIYAEKIEQEECFFGDTYKQLEKMLKK